MKRVYFLYNSFLELIYGKDYKYKKMEQLLKTVISNLSTTTFQGITNFINTDENISFKYHGADMVIKKDIIYMDGGLVGLITLYNYSKISFTGSNHVKIDPFDLFVYPNQSVKIKNYIQFNNPMSVTIDSHGYIYSNIHTINNTYFKQLESMLIQKSIPLTIN